MPTGTPNKDKDAPALSKDELGTGEQSVVGAEAAAEEPAVLIFVPGLCGQYGTAKFNNKGYSEEPVPAALAKRILTRFKTAKTVESIEK